MLRQHSNIKVSQRLGLWFYLTKSVLLFVGLTTKNEPLETTVLIGELGRTTGMSLALILYKESFPAKMGSKIIAI